MRTFAALALMLLASSAAFGQSAPFDMSGERPAETITDPAANAAGVVEPDPAVAGTPASDANVAGPVRRYLVPFAELALSGETARRAWSVYLTQEQAASPTTLNVGYQNAIVVAPEASQLTLTINGSKLLTAPIASSESVSDLTAEIPANLLHAGLNDVTIEAVQRHRTDCTIQSTYELWTQIDTSKTFLTFAAPEAGHRKRVDDLRAIGVDALGTTTFHLVVPSMSQAISTAPAMRLSESLMLLAGMPNQSVSISEGTAAAAAKPGAVNVILGLASELSQVLAVLPAGAETSPTAALVDDPRFGPGTLVVTGPSWQAVDAAIESIAKQVDRPIATDRTTLSTRAWRTPDVPMLLDATQRRFSDLGVDTLEFSGRRLRTDFAIGIPSDFYANAYGEATILLDAAYSQEVLPGSHIDIYVNDQIAATVPITTAGGEILRHLPIKVTMRHFRPGDNQISIEAVLMTQADLVCAPGATALGNGRFVLFDTSEFVMPRFARMGQTPNLASISGTGFPYSRIQYALPLIVDRTQPDALSAAATLLGRMSIAAGRLIPVDTDVSVASVADRNALFVGPASQVAPAVLAQVGIGADTQTNWGDTVASVRPDTEATFDQWRERLSGSGWRGQVSSFQDWMNRTFNISIDSFRIFPGPPSQFSPDGSASVLVAQDVSPMGEGTWTLVTSPSVGALADGVAALTSQANWRNLDGRISTFDAANMKVASLPVTRASYFATQAASFANYRLIAANWLSANALYYSLLLTLLSILLGLVTAGFLRTLGRTR